MWGWRKVIRKATAQPWDRRSSTQHTRPELLGVSREYVGFISQLFSTFFFSSHATRMVSLKFLTIRPNLRLPVLKVYLCVCVCFFFNLNEVLHIHGMYGCMHFQILLPAGGQWSDAASLLTPLSPAPLNLYVKKLISLESSVTQPFTMEGNHLK